MTLWINTTDKYTDAYYTNWSYLNNMTDLQMKVLEEMGWYEDYIGITLWRIPAPWVFPYKKDAKYSTKDFIDDLNERIMGL